MDLHSIESVLMPRTRAELPAWSAATAVLSGGTWLFSEKQPHLRRLIYLTAMGWESLTVDDRIAIGDRKADVRLPRPPSSLAHRRWSAALGRRSA